MAATVEFDSALLGTSTISPGAIIPDPSGFISFGTPGIADASYDSLFAASGESIVSNGLFFSFDVTALAEGSGTIAFSFLDSFGFDDLGAALDPVDGLSDAAFSISGASTNAVPEPSALLLMLGGASLVIAQLTRAATRARVLD